MTIAESEDFVTRHWPTEIRVASDKRALTVGFDGGERVEIPAELLRVESPSAEVQGHSAAGKQVVAGKGKVAIASVEPVGNYAVRIGFDDGHATGLYTWRYLYKLGTEGDRLMAAYLAELEAKGLSR
ncbi:MAG: DUF971 domain-containing protein [Alphaproteobacteria bacterium]|nr:DUF971 domain-containing protein [Alphaproteobacteria bacterium]